MNFPKQYTSILLWMLWSTPVAKSFMSPSPSFLTKQTYTKNTLELCGRKKGGLAQEDFSVQKTKKKTKKKNSNSGKDESVQVSSSLSQWAATLGTEDSASTSSSTTLTPPESIELSSSSSSGASTFTPFEEEKEKRGGEEVKSNKKSQKNKKQSKSNDSSRRQRLEQKQNLIQAYNQKVESILSSIEEIISSNNFDVKPLLSYIEQLVVLQKEQEEEEEDTSLVSFKQLFSNKQSYDYNLAWVGSDDAICHLGTGLHKVPLARLQDIFLTLSGNASGGSSGVEVNIPKGLLKGASKKKNKYFITVMEVIRILGPFPNVRNTLQGRIMMNETNLRKTMSMRSSSINSSSGQNTVKIVYDSMMDGLGKEIKAGNDDDIRTLDLNIVFANENAIVGVVPSLADGLGEEDDDLSMMKAFGNNGENVLLFLREDDIDSTLEGLRAN